MFSVLWVQQAALFAIYIHLESTFESIPETPIMATSRVTSKTSSATIHSTSQDQNSSRLCGSFVDPITIGDNNSSDDSEPEIMPLHKRICTIGSEKSLTPSQAAGAAALRRLSAVESNKRSCDFSAASPRGNETRSHEKKTAPGVRQTAGSDKVGSTQKQFQVGPSTSTGISSISGRSEPSNSSATVDQHVDLSSPQFVLRPGNGNICSIVLLIVYTLYVLAGEFEVILCVDNSESTASRKYCDT